jgi:hypothetical protein
MEYEFSKDVGFGDLKPTGFQKIKCCMIYAVKHDGRHKAHFVAGGHLTIQLEDRVYSSAVSIRSLHILLLVAEQNGFQLMSADVGNVYTSKHSPMRRYNSFLVQNLNHLDFKAIFLFWLRPFMFCVHLE